MFKPCCVIPVYNHVDVIATTLAAVLDRGLAVVLVNDGSDARCTDVLRELGAKHDAVALVELPENGGKGAAVKAGLCKAHALGYSHAVQVDADGQHNLDDLARFLYQAEANPDVLVVGQPAYDDSIPRGRLYGRYLTHIWVWINTLSLAIKDSMCGFRVYPLAPVCRLLATNYTGDRMDFDCEILVRWLWAGGDVVNLATHVHYPADGVSHFLLVRDNLLISWMHTRLFFGMLARAPLWLLGIRRRGHAL
jgi:glycosyltransferase involved in cell wall biosynthesis